MVITIGLAGNTHDAARDQIQRVAFFALTDDAFAGGDRALHQTRRDLGKIRFRHVMEKRYLAQQLVRIEAKPTIILPPEQSDFLIQIFQHRIAHARRDGTDARLILDDFGFSVDQKAARQTFLYRVDKFREFFGHGIDVTLCHLQPDPIALADFGNPVKARRVSKVL